MKTTHIYLLAGALAMASCSNDIEEYTTSSNEEIKLSISGVENMVATRAAVAFPNNGEIGVTAVLTKEANAFSSADWNNNIYINNQEASTTEQKETGLDYSFTWGTRQYWPLKNIHTNSELTFIAYSPKVVDSRFTIAAADQGDDKDKMKFTMNLPPISEDEVTQDMPDVLYSTQSIGTRGNRGFLDMGTFNHALSQMSVVISYKDMNPRMYLTRFQVTVPNSGSFIHPGSFVKEDLTITEPTYTRESSTITYAYNIEKYQFVANPDDQKDKLTYLYLNSGMSGTQEGVTTGTPFFVLPGSDVKIELEFKDYTNGLGDGSESSHTPGYTVTKEFTLADFLNGGDTATLGRAKNTRLQINLVGHSVGITATLEPWVDKGNFVIGLD